MKVLVVVVALGLAARANSSGYNEQDSHFNDDNGFVSFLI